jgi:hypothetical protein
MSQRALDGSNASWLGPRRVALTVLVAASILLSPLLVVYEFVVGLVLVIAGYALPLMKRGGSRAGPNVEVYGIALLAGPLVYALAWMLGGLFDW